MSAKPIDAQLKDLDKAFLRAALDIRSATLQGMTASTIVVQSDALRRAPVDTGLLRKSIARTVEQNMLKTIGKVGTNVEYAPFIEFGTSKAKSQPFLIPGLESNINKIKGLIAAAIKKVIR